MKRGARPFASCRGAGEQAQILEEYDSQINALCYLGTMPSPVLFFHMHPLKKPTDTFPAALGL